MGAGRGTISEDDEDLQDAARLATPLGDGILWHPSTLADIYATPNKVLVLFDLYRFGMGSRMHPWTWWRVKDKRVQTHQYTSDWQGMPERPARCGYRASGDTELERFEIGKCSRCEKLDDGQSDEATGTGVRRGDDTEDNGDRQDHP